VFKHLQLSAERSAPYIRRAAVVGVFGIQKGLLEIINRFITRPIVAFDNIEEAKDWLISELP
jgi:hypothetical protein